MKGKDQKTVLIRNVVLLVLLFAFVFAFRWSCISENGTKYPETLDKEDLGIQEKVKDLPPFVVTVEGGDHTGSGIILGFGEKVFILCDYDIIAEAVTARVEFLEEEWSPAAIESVNEEIGIAIISVWQEDLSFTLRKDLKKAIITRNQNLQKDEEVVLAGEDISYGKVISLSDVYGIMDGEMHLIKTDISTESRENGFLINDEEKVIGMIQETGDVTVFLGLSEITSRLSSMVNHTKTAWLGIYGESSSGDLRGIVVRELSPGSPGEENGIAVGDIITRIDGKRITSMRELQVFLEGKAPEDEVNVEFENREEITLVLGEI